MSLDQAFLTQISSFVDVCKLQFAGGVTASDLAETAVRGMRLAIGLLDRLDMPGVEKKAEVLKLVGFLFDQYADACVPLAVRPIWWVVKPAVRALVMSLSSGAVEALLPLVRSAK